MLCYRTQIQSLIIESTTHYIDFLTLFTVRSQYTIIYSFSQSLWCISQIILNICKEVLMSLFTNKIL